MGSGQRGLAPDPHTLPNWLHELEQWSKLCTLKLPDLGNGIRTHMYTPGFCKEESEVKVIQLGPTLSNPMDCSPPGSSVFLCLRSLFKFMFNELVMLSSHLTLCTPFPSCFLSFPASGSLPMSWLFVSGGQGIGISLQHQSFE